MSASALSLEVGFALVLVYAIAFGVRKKRFANLVTLFLLFLVGPIFAESVDVLKISYRHGVLGQQVEMGVFRDHSFVIAFSSVVLMFAALRTVFDLFRSGLGGGIAGGGGGSGAPRPGTP